MLREISRTRFWNGVAAHIHYMDNQNFFRRQFNMSFLLIKLVIHLLAWLAAILIYFLVYSQTRGADDTLVGILGRPCDIKLWQMCAHNSTFNCSGKISRDASSDEKEYWEVKLALAGSFQTPETLHTIDWTSGHLNLHGAKQSICRKLI
jgi:hypothetical protein